MHFMVKKAKSVDSYTVEDVLAGPAGPAVIENIDAVVANIVECVVNTVIENVDGVTEMIESADIDMNTNTTIEDIEDVVEDVGGDGGGVGGDGGGVVRVADIASGGVDKESFHACEGISPSMTSFNISLFIDFKMM